MDPWVKKATLCQEAKLYKCLSISSTGNKQFAEEPIIIKGKYVGQVEYIQSLKGSMVVSTQQFYVDGPDILQISEGDMIELPHVNKRRPVVKMQPYYKGAKLDYGVIYLE